MMFISWSTSNLELLRSTMSASCAASKGSPGMGVEVISAGGLQRRHDGIVRNLLLDGSNKPWRATR